MAYACTLHVDDSSITGLTDCTYFLSMWSLIYMLKDKAFLFKKKLYRKRKKRISLIVILKLKDYFTLFFSGRVSTLSSKFSSKKAKA